MDNNLPNNLPDDKDKEKKNEVKKEENYSYKKEHSAFSNWFINLFKGYWYGMTDLFLASWVNVIVLVLMTLVPLIYGIISVLAYWNPANSLGKMQIAIFDEDSTFIKVTGFNNESKAAGTQDDGDNKPASAGYTYHTGALSAYMNDGVHEINFDDAALQKVEKVANGSTITPDIIKTALGFTDNTKLILNNGFVVNYTEATLQAENTWDTLKNTQLIKESPNKSDEDSKFRVAFVPDPRLNFKNIKYISDKDETNSKWMTGKYAAQIKINAGYGAAIAGMTGMALDNQYQTPDPNYNKPITVSLPDGTTVNVPVTTDLTSNNFGTWKPNDSTSQQLAAYNFLRGQQFFKTVSDASTSTAKLQTFATFERNFISQYLLHSMMSLKDDLIRDSAPVLNGLADPFNSEQIFGVSGNDIRAVIDNTSNSPASAEAKNAVENKFDVNQRYLILDGPDFVKWVGSQDGMNGFSLTNDKTGFTAKTLFGSGNDNDNDNSDGSFGNWLKTYQYFMNGNSPAYNALYPESSNALAFMKQSMNRLTAINDDFIPYTKLDPKQKPLDDLTQRKIVSSAVRALVSNGMAANGDKNLADLVNNGYLNIMIPAISKFVPTTDEQKQAISNWSKEDDVQTAFKGAQLKDPKLKEIKTGADIAEVLTAAAVGHSTLLNIPDPLLTKDVPFLAYDKENNNIPALFNNIMKDKSNGYENWFVYFPYLEQSAVQLADIKNDNNIHGDPQWMSVQEARDYLSVNAIGDAYSKLISTIAANGVDLGALNQSMGTRGGDRIVYGVGLGTMMMFVGYFIGFTVLRSLIKRDKHFAKLHWSNWYISKFLQYATIGFIQVALVVWVVYGAGWHKYVSASAMALDWVWMLESAFVMLAIIIGLQYAINPGIGAIIAIMYLALNVTSGGGSYPGWMETGFFHVMSWLSPFSYSIAGSDQIVFGIDIAGHNSESTAFMLRSWGYLTCFFVFFFGIGFLGARKSMRAAMYGTPSSKHVYEALLELGRYKEATKFRTVKKNKDDTLKTTKDGKPKFEYHWNELSPLGDVKISEKVSEIVRKKLVFKWYIESRKKRHLDELELVNDQNSQD